MNMKSLYSCSVFCTDFNNKYGFTTPDSDIVLGLSPIYVWYFKDSGNVHIFVFVFYIGAL